MIQSIVTATCETAIWSALKTAFVTYMERKSEISDPPVSCVGGSDCNVDILSVILSEKFSGWISLKYLFLRSSTNA